MLSIKQLLDICEGVPRRDYAPGDILLHEDRPSSGMLLFLVSGTVEIIKGDDILITKVLKPGSPIGEMSLLLRRPITATVRAVTPTCCLVVEDGISFLKCHTDVLLTVSELLAQRLHAATTYLADIKQQYKERDPSLAMIDEVLDALIHQAHDDGEPASGSEREADPNK